MSKAIEKKCGIKLESLRQQIKVIQNDIRDNEQDEVSLEFHLDNLKQIAREKRETFESLLDVVQSQEQLTDIQTFQNGVDESYRTVFLDVSRRLKSFQTDPLQSSQESDKQIARNENSIRLPTIPLPTFRGNYEDWVYFRENFEQLIIQNQDLSDFQRLCYLKSSLKDEAAKVQSPNDTFQSLWEALTNRFANERTIVEKQITGLFNIKTVLRESAVELRCLLDSFVKHIRILETMDMEMDKMSESMIIHLVINKLDNETRKLFEMSQDPKVLPTWSEMVAFLENRCHALENVDKVKTNTTKNDNHHSTHKNSTRSTVLISKSSSKCKMCHQDHYINQCNNFLSLSTDQRWEKVKAFNMCFNCLSPSHSAKTCKRGVCRKCNAMHHTLLHRDGKGSLDVSSTQTDATSSSDTHRTNAMTVQTNPNDNNIQPKTTDSAPRVSFLATNYEVLLSTVVLNILNEHNEPMPCRAILDSGSQSNFLTERMSQLLKRKRCTVNVPIFGIDDKSTVVRHKISAMIQSRTTDYSIDTEFLIIPKITGFHPNTKISTGLIQTPPNIILADPDFRTPQRIDMLLGIEVFCDVWLSNQIRSGPELPIFCETLFGWIVAGRCSNKPESKTKFCGLSISIGNQLMTEIKKFWEIENCTTNTMSIEEKEVEKHFIETHKRNSDGRYVVYLPTKPNITDLGDTKAMACKRFENLEKKLSTNPELKLQYQQFMQEYIDLGHMTLTPTTTLQDIDYFMPHHGVLKPTSSTTKLRVVFDASASSTSGLSLNNVLKIGPTVQPQLFDILLRFRKHQYAFSADINKMYRQVLIDDSQHRLQQILWRSNTNDDISAFSLKTVTYGTASAPYLATRALSQLANDERTKFPKAAEVTTMDFYVDDVLSGSDSLQEAKTIQAQLIELLRCGGFKLHKWCANHPELLNAISPNDREQKVVVGDCETIKTLGLTWQPTTDEFVFSIERIFNNERPITKRSILSDIARLYDPLGLTGPIIVKAKVMLQNLWQQTLDWDDELNDTDRDEWLLYRNQLQKMPDLHVQRCVIPNESIKSIFLLGFCDASTKAYGACIYLHCIDIYGAKKTTLLCSKSKVAPLKVITIPRLELCSAVLLVQLMAKVKDAMKLKIEKTIFWSDSTVTLGWINSKSSDAKTFVSHRIAEIQNLSHPNEWKYISTKQNPADVISRGLMPNELANSNLWWHGPNFLENPEEQWQNPDYVPEEDLPEMKTNILIATKPFKDGWKFLSYYGNFIHLQRRMAVIMRFVNNCRKKKVDRITSTHLTATDLSIGLMRTVLCAQREEFGCEYEALTKGTPISKKSPLFRLNVFLDDQQLIRVGGRIRNSKQCFDVKFQIVLPKAHHVTNSLIRHLHIQHSHVGQRTLLSIIRQRFWPIDAQNTIRRIVRRCVKCFRCKPEVCNQMMGDLPECRTVVCHPFLNTGVDYAGPFELKLTKNTTVKSYAAIFVCLSTKATHIEIVSNLTSEAFIAALIRFFSRRGNCLNLYSDNGKNFVGTKTLLDPLFEVLNNETIQNQIYTECSARMINFHFIPPRAPHFGGLWESTVKQIKYHMVRVCDHIKLNFEEMSTVFSKIEAILNSRPLFSESNDPEDVNAITPGHFLIGRPLNALVEPNYCDVNTNRLKRWQIMQQITQHFWYSWSTDYLTSLQIRSKSITKTEILVGMLVVIKEDNIPPLQWRLGRIKELHPGKDNVTRVVTLHTKYGVVKRPVNKICILPIE